MNLGGDAIGEAPRLIEWVRDDLSQPVLFYTDMRLHEVESAPASARKIALLVEPPSLHDTHYRAAHALQDRFDAILTFDRKFIAAHPEKARFYPFGGSWIKLDAFGVFPKSREVSLILSEKRGAAGHRLRIEVAKSMRVDIAGRGTPHPMRSKLEILRDWRYSIVIESIQMGDYFSEKILDCLSQGTVPIYWGSPNIGEYFDKRGLIPFHTLQELEHILVSVANKSDYEMRLPAIYRNVEIAKSFRCAEDCIASAYGDLFE